MLDINLIRKEPEMVRAMLVNRFNDTEALDAILALDVPRREILLQSETLRATRNAVSKEIGRMKDKTEQDAKKAEMRAVGDQISALEVELNRLESQLHDLTAGLPNILDPRVQIGRAHV